MCLSYKLIGVEAILLWYKQEFLLPHIAWASNTGHAFVMQVSVWHPNTHFCDADFCMVS